MTPAFRAQSQVLFAVLAALASACGVPGVGGPAAVPGADSVPADPAGLEVAAATYLTDAGRLLRAAVVLATPSAEKPRFELTAAPLHGQFALQEDGSFTYQPLPEYAGTDGFSVRVTTSRGSGPSARLPIMVRPAGDTSRPLITAFTTDEDHAVTGRIPSSGLAGPALLFARLSGPEHGAVTLDATSGAFSYTPAPDFAGSDQFEYRVNDDTSSVQGLITVSVAPVNDPPIAWPQSLTLAEDGSASGSLTATDVDSGQLTLRVVRPPARGAVVLDASSGAFTYTPAQDANGADSFDFVADDGEATSAPATVTLTIAPVNDPPTALSALYLLEEDGSAAGTFPAVDTDGDALAWILVEGPRHGACTLETGSGRFAYVPAPDFNGDDVLRFAVSDGRASSAPATVTLRVLPVNDAPVAQPLSVSLDEEGSRAGRVAATDVEGDPLTYAVALPPAHGVLALAADGSFTYTPDRDFNGSDGFLFTASDGRLVSAPARVELTVRPVNDAPVAQGLALALDEDTAALGRVAATDVDGAALTYRVVQPPAHGLLDLDPLSGAFTYAPARDFNGSDSFLFAASDGELESTPAPVELTVRPVNDAPVAQDQALALDEERPIAGRVAATDVEGDPLTYAVALPPAHGALTLAADGAFTYTPDRDFNGRDGFFFAASDGRLVSAPARVELTVRPVNDPPLAQGLALALDEDTTALGRVVATDVDNATLTYRVVRPPAHGLLDLDPLSGAFTYTPVRDFNGSDSFLFAARDEESESAPAAVDLTVRPVNDAPVAQGQPFATDEDSPLAGHLLATDVDGPALSFALLLAPAHGTLALDPATGAFDYRPAPDWYGTDGFSFAAADGLLSSAPALVTIEVRPVNDPPVTTDQELVTDEDVAVSGRVVGSDVDGPTLVFQVVEGPLHGALTFDPTTGAFTYVPERDWNGLDLLRVVVSDGLAQATSSVALRVRPLNDAPVAQEQAIRVDEDGAFSGLFVASDVDSPAVTFSPFSGPAHGTVQVEARTGTFVYHPTPYYSGPDEFWFTASDGQVASAPARVAITVVPLPPSPAVEAPGFAIVGRGPITATAAAAPGLAVEWAIESGVLESPATLPVLSFSAVAPPQLALTAVAVDGAGRRSHPTRVLVPVGAAPNVPVSRTVELLGAPAGPLSLDLPSQPDRARLSVSLTNLSRTAVRNPQIYSGAAPLPYEMADVLESLQGTTDRERAEAAWRYVRDRFFPYCSGASPDPDPEIDRHNFFSSGAVQTYGFGCCDQVANYLATIWSEMGFTARVAAMPFHTVAEVYYDAAWHMYDANHRTYYPRRDRQTVASTEEVLADPELVALAGDESGHDPVGWLAVRMADLYAANDTLWYFAPRPAGTPTELALQRGETFTFYERNQTQTSVFLLSFGDAFLSSAVASARSHWHLSADDDGLALADGVDGLTTAPLASGRLVFSQAGGSTGAMTFRRDSPYVLLGTRVFANLVAAPGSATARISFDGATWSEAVPLAATRERPGYTHVAELTPLARPRHRYFVRFELGGGAQATGIGLESEVQVNASLFPALRQAAAAQFQYKDGSPPGQERRLLASAEAESGDNQIKGLTLWRSASPAGQPAAYVEVPEILAGAGTGAPESVLDYLVKLDSPALVRQLQLTLSPAGAAAATVNWSVETRTSPGEPWVVHASGSAAATTRLAMDTLVSTQELRVRAEASSPLLVVRMAVFHDE